MSQTEEAACKKVARKNRAAEIASALEWLIITFTLIFVWRGFVMEAFRIPTGSMAETLKGAHFRLRCPQCGYRYDYGLGNYGLPQDTMPSGYLQTKFSRCPSCGHYQPTGGTMPVANGDRVLVLKCIYQFLEPKRWDVIVFKNPLGPSENYIKRLVGRPGETVEIIDGDIYINGKISRKPPKVQNQLWMPVYDNDYQPVRPLQGSFNGHTWHQPFSLVNSNWRLEQASPTEFGLDSGVDEINWLVYDTSGGNDFRAAYAYNEIEEYDIMPYCSDLMVRFYAKPRQAAGCIGIELSKYQTRYKGWLDLAGDMVIARVANNEKTVALARKPVEVLSEDKPTLIKFTNVDHQLILEVGDEKLSYDLGRGPNGAGPRKTDIQPQVKIFGSGKLTLGHIAIFRDIHYTSDGLGPGRATEGNPFTLEKNEFFALGDNSPNSLDCRWWNRPGMGNNNRFFRQGVVPRDYLVGKALLVYWPSGFRPFSRSRFALIPNVGRMRLIYGGSNKKM